MFILILPILCSSLTLDKKENACFLLANGSLKHRISEFKALVEDNPDIEKRKLYTKIVEDTFYYCLKRIKEEHVINIGYTEPKIFTEYQHLISIPYDYNKFNDLENSEEFLNLRNKIVKRISNEKDRLKRKEL